MPERRRETQPIVGFPVDLAWQCSSKVDIEFSNVVSGPPSRGRGLGVLFQYKIGEDAGVRKSFTLLMALAMLISPEAASAFPIEHPTMQYAPAVNSAIEQVVYRRRTTVRHNTTVRRGPRGGTVVRRNTTVRRNTVARRTVVARPVRPWVRRPYYGRVVAGVALGTVVAVAATRAPAAPASNLCWYWSNSSQTRGYWDYCR
jgi:hypothetical protein